MDVDRLDLLLVGVVLLGVVFDVYAPPDPQYYLEVEPADGAETAQVRAFEDLGSHQQALFREALDADALRFPESPAIDRGHVRYRGTVYHVRPHAQEGGVFSVLLPLAGMWIVALGSVALVGRRLWRLVR